MSTIYNTSLVTSGLVLCHDPANSRSYSGTTTTTNNLFSSSTGTLSAGVGYSNGNNGFFVFNGSNGSIDLGNASSVQLTSGTICVWARASSPGASFRGIVAKQNAFGFFYNNSILSAYDWFGGGAERSSGVNIGNGVWTHITYVFQSGVANGSTFYINGSSVNSHNLTISNQTANLYMGAEVNAGQYTNGNIGHFCLYNRVLTLNEILQNYNATKKRYL